ncbi:enoyl-CoA hydratase/isomerase family protein [Williamsia deligens]|uniref:3-hydroxyisobutyryl-CoA hydrolase n=1 Tax=Williamsia deligens TaxID=321325 RepID=A0ABW3GDF5_9NOCA|nr:enoyl-CoA hydratase/isomerase family protein [Williamsia deligens]MCP2192481.1 enoyl-CoA hydratase [Williamsia deligens]
MSYIRSSLANGVGEIVLDRPKALNALDQTMIDDMTDLLRRWADDDTVETVLVTSGSERAFCAGGDIRAIRDNALAADAAAITKYFGSEYELDQLVADFPKPYVSMINGAAMGGGLGISVHGEVRVVTESTMMAMPETAIGFFPDVGATYFLPRLPAGVGMWLGLTGSRISGADAVAVGMATHFVPADDFGTVADRIRSGAPLPEVFGDLAAPPSSDLRPSAIAEYFDDTSVAGVVGGLQGAVGDEWAQSMVTALRAASPTSLLVTAALIEAGERSTLAECFERELHAAERICATPDFAEGVRAVLVDKDRNPSFMPASLEDVDPHEVVRIVTGS